MPSDLHKLAYLILPAVKPEAQRGKGTWRPETGNPPPAAPGTLFRSQWEGGWCEGGLARLGNGISRAGARAIAPVLMRNRCTQSRGPRPPLLCSPG